MAEYLSEDEERGVKEGKQILREEAESREHKEIEGKRKLRESREGKEPEKSWKR